MAQSKSYPVPTEFPETGLGAWLLEANGADFCARFNALNAQTWRMPIAIEWHAAGGLYEVIDLAEQPAPQRTITQRIAVARRERVFRYRRGVAHRIRKLAAKYFLDRIAFGDGDVVIDCGANVGEVGLYVRSRADVNVTAIEPSATEAAACDANLFDGRAETHRLGLWHCEGVLTFYDSNATGDSSLIAPAEQHAAATEIKTTTLTKLVDTAGIERIKLLKIEGEGAEPEILEGGRSVLSRVQHCCVDCGPERGASQDHVIAPVVNLMTGCGFEVVDVNLERQIFWFRNRALS